MSKFKTKQSVKTMLSLAVLQATATVSFSAVMLYCFDAREALSSFFGGMIAVISSLYFAQRASSANVLSNPEQLLAQFYASEIIKVVLTLLMIGICIIFLKVSMLPFIISYLLAAVVVNCLVLLLPETSD